jgi:hypothetical protein
MTKSKFHTSSQLETALSRAALPKTHSVPLPLWCLDPVSEAALSPASAGPKLGLKIQVRRMHLWKSMTQTIIIHQEFLTLNIDAVVRVHAEWFQLCCDCAFALRNPCEILQDIHEGI